MNESQTQTDKASSTQVIFDLAEELTAEELESFKKAAADQGVDITSHFLNITIRKPHDHAA